MNIDTLSPKVSVSGQISEQDIPALVERGVELIICNRPDNEDVGQPLFDDIKKAAEQAGIAAEMIPFSGGEMTDAQVHDFKQLVGSGKKIHAYCRSGNRSSVIWGASQN